MNQESRKRQRPFEEDNNRPSVGGNSEWSFNFEEENNTTTMGNNQNANELMKEMKEIKLKMAALEV
jgi:hypothetical protein